MKVQNFTNASGRPVVNQFLITIGQGSIYGNFLKRETFQSYDSTIAIRTVWRDRVQVELDEHYWDYSKTTAKYRNLFLGEDTRETQKKIKSGEYTLTDLNKGE